MCWCDCMWLIPVKTVANLLCKLILEIIECKIVYLSLSNYQMWHNLVQDKANQVKGKD